MSEDTYEHGIKLSRKRHTARKVERSESDSEWSISPFVLRKVIVCISGRVKEVEEGEGEEGGEGAWVKREGERNTYKEKRKRVREGERNVEGWKRDNVLLSSFRCLVLHPGEDLR